MAGIASTTAVPAGSRVVVEFSGALPFGYTDSVFKENLGNQLRLIGLDVESIVVVSGYGVSSRDYTATATVRTATPGKVSGIAGYFTSAVENAGGYTPTVTIPSIGQSAQPALQPGVIDNVIADIAKLGHTVTDALGTAAEGIAKTPKEVANVSKLLIIGIVVIVALVALGPNLKGIGRGISVGV